MSAGTAVAPIDATTGSMARRHGWSTPPGAVASTTSLVISAKKSTMATSLTANEIANVKRVVALGRGVDPDQGDQRAQRQQKQVLDGEPRQTWNSRSHAMP